MLKNKRLYDRILVSRCQLSVLSVDEHTFPFRRVSSALKVTRNKNRLGMFTLWVCVRVRVRCGTGSSLCWSDLSLDFNVNSTSETAYKWQWSSFIHHWELLCPLSCRGSCSWSPWLLDTYRHSWRLAPCSLDIACSASETCSKNSSRKICSPLTTMLLVGSLLFLVLGLYY